MSCNCSRRFFYILLVCAACGFGTDLQAGLKFDGRSGYVRIPSLRIEASSPTTYEFIVTPQHPVDEFGRLLTNFDVSNQKRSGLFIGVWKGYWVAAVSTERGVRMLLSDDPVVIGARVHLAAVYENDQVRLYLNGRPCSSPLRLQKPIRTSNEDFLMGAQRIHNYREKYGFRFTGEFEAVRISKSTRYARQFEPPAKLESDDKTLLLYNFDAKVENEVKDQSSLGINGLVKDVRWIHQNPKQTYDNIEELKTVIGDYLVTRNVKGSNVKIDSIFRLTPSRQVLEKGKKIGKWEPGEKKSLTVSLDNESTGSITLARRRTGSLVGNQRKGGRSIVWSMQRIGISMLWSQRQYDDDRLVKTFYAILYSNGRIGNIDGPATWTQNRNVLQYDWANKNKARLSISRDRQTYQGRNLDGHNILGTRIDQR